MKNKLNLFSQIVNIIWYILITLWVVSLLLVLLYYIKTPVSLDHIQLFGIKLKAENPLVKYFLPIVLIFWICILYGFFLFKKLINHFNRKTFFTDFAINTLKRIGYLFIVLTMLNSLIKVILENLAARQNGQYNTDLVLGTFIYPMLLGFFFIVLSEVFKVAKVTKQENDLTI